MESQNVRGSQNLNLESTGSRADSVSSNGGKANAPPISANDDQKANDEAKANSTAVKAMAEANEDVARAVSASSSQVQEPCRTPVRPKPWGIVQTGSRKREKFKIPR